MFYQTVVAVVLLYASKSWILSPFKVARLEGFHTECVWRLTGMQLRYVNGKWI